MNQSGATRDVAGRLARAGLLTGLLDGTFASVMSLVNQSTVSRVWRGVAAVLVGPGALDGGAGTVALGISMHFGVAFAWSAIFLVLLPRAAWLRRLAASPWGTLKVAAIYGPFIWLFMSLVVIPILVQRPPSFTARWWIQLVGHVPFVGLPIAASCIRRDAD